MKLHINIKSFLLIAGVTTLLSSCYYDSLEELHPAPIIIPGINDSTSTGCDTTKAITYTADIKTILDGNCGTSICHNGANASNNFVDLNTYSGAKDAATRIVSAITWDGTASNMPKNSPSKINDCYIAKIKKWVNTGTAE
jgi:hypothetical protein